MGLVEQRPGGVLNIPLKSRMRPFEELLYRVTCSNHLWKMVLNWFVSDRN